MAAAAVDEAPLHLTHTCISATAFTSLLSDTYTGGSIFSCR